MKIPFAKEAWPFVLPFAAAAVVLAVAGRPGWAVASLVVALAVLLFFRNPSRRYDGDPQAILAPADGFVTGIDSVKDETLGPGSFHRIVTFLSLFDVHVQRTPASGEVIRSRYSPGRKVAAFRAHADEVNEQHLTVIQHPGGDRVGVRQIAGLLARRVVCYLKEEDRVERGQLLGLIKFGSRVDLLVPESYQILVRRGEHVRNGETVVAVPRPPEEGAR